MLRLPENMALEDVSDAMRLLGYPMDRTVVSRALREVVIRGMREPETPRGRWRLPRSKLIECVGACLLRRASRNPRYRGDLRPERYVTAAAELMLRHPELDGHVPRRARAEILERYRLEAEERARAERKARREAKAAERRARELEARREFNHVRGECYWRCRSLYRSRTRFEFPSGTPGSVAEREKFDRAWPEEVPAWWMPPPEMHDAMRDFQRERKATRNYMVCFEDKVPRWDDWLPPYQPGAPWPWRRSEAEADAGVG